MKKRSAALLLISVMLLVLCSCGKAEAPKDNGEKPSTDDKVFTVNGQEFRMDAEKSFSGINYSVPEDFKEVDHYEFTPYIQYNYLQEDSSNLLYFRIFYYEGKGNEAAIKDLGLQGEIKYTEGKTGDIDYQLYAEPRDDGGTMHFYFIHKDGDTYVLSFVSKYDIADFEKKVLNSLSF